jgi:hypothetical protein
VTTTTLPPDVVEDYAANEAVCYIGLFKPDCALCCSAETGGDLCDECHVLHRHIVAIIRDTARWYANRSGK